MKRRLAILALVLLAVLGPQTRAMAAALRPEKTASGVFAANYDQSAQSEAPQTLDLAMWCVGGSFLVRQAGTSCSSLERAERLRQNRPPLSPTPLPVLTVPGAAGAKANS